MTVPSRDSPIVYSAESQIRTPAKLISGMYHDLLASRELAWRLFIRDISARYRQSALGVLWAFVPAIVSGLIFIVLQAKNILNVPPTDIPYPVFAIIGTTVWQIFSESITAPLRAVQLARPVLAKINFPREALLLSAFYEQMFGVAVKFIVMIAALLIMQYPIGVGFLLAIPAVVLLVLLGMAIGLILTPAGMLYNDVSSALPIIVQFWFFLTPVVYPPLETFPYSLLTWLNPVSPLLLGVRDLMTKDALTMPASFGVVGVLTLIGLLIAWVLYRVSMPIIIERMSS